MSLNPPRIVPVSAILPTRNRAPILERFLDSLAAQDTLPREIVICDASDGHETRDLVEAARPVSTPRAMLGGLSEGQWAPQ